MDNKNYIQLFGINPKELFCLHKHFTKKVENWYILKKKAPNAPIEESFIMNDSIIPLGLWMELVSMCLKEGLSLHFEPTFDSNIRDVNLKRENFDAYVTELFSKCLYKPRGYQVDSVFNVLSYKKCCADVTTGGGKTLICYILFRYMIDVLKIKHILYITPKTNLTTQSAEKFVKYDKDCHIETNWSYYGIHANAKKLKEYNQTIVFANYQSLRNKREDFFAKYDVVIVDECHHGKSPSIKTILSKCGTAKYKIGLTGSFPEEGTYKNFVLQSYLGPVVYRFTSEQLIYEEKFATPVHVIGLKLRYLRDAQCSALYDMRVNRPNDPTYGNKLYHMEQDICRESKLRFQYICDLIGKTTKNTLVIYTDIKNGYGRKVYEYIKENGNKRAYYIDGDTPTQNREYIKNAMEDDTTGNTVIVSSIGCFSEGIDIANLWNIILIESTKSDVNITQLLGRGMRRYEGKDVTMMIDIGDDYCYGDDAEKRENYLHKHFKERIKMYDKKGFPYKIYDVNLLYQYQSLI